MLRFMDNPVTVVKGRRRDTQFRGETEIDTGSHTDVGSRTISLLLKDRCLSLVMIKSRRDGTWWVQRHVESKRSVERLQSAPLQKVRLIRSAKGDSRGYGGPRREGENRSRAAGFGPIVHRNRVQGWCQRGQSGLVGLHVAAFLAPESSSAFERLSNLASSSPIKAEQWQWSF
ncbi:hypothetical protein T265_07603 [Opisthorchis viverrini]|uniref:Uncharacterized protein n=1 Tax=Opisthorchis viverrini TaxID=6198 RepID=A0A074ZGM9_OPIVI|nr:hypothetical protein T265_07603 [Opisthorchis viverrini]KER24817.1 hypothetical protein T265_07603 [Opisthorchis viverrini]